MTASEPVRAYDEFYGITLTEDQAKTIDRSEDVYALVGELLIKVDALTAKFDAASAQINGIAEMAGPAIEQISASPIMKLLGGGKRV